jgi:hypothetical protein
MASTAESSSSMYDMFTRSQQRLFEDWAKAIQDFQKGLQASVPSEKITENTHDVLKLYDTWKESAGKYLDALMSACPGNQGTDTFSKVFGAADAYTKLYEVWEPLAKALQQQALDFDSYEALLDPARYMETIDRIFGFASPSAVADLPGRATELMETWGAKAQQFLKPWADAMRSSVDASLAAQSGDPGAAMDEFRSLYSAFEGTFGKVLNMPAVGKDREQVEMLSRTIDRYAVYQAKNVELQRRMYTIAQQAMEKVVQTLAQKVKDGEEVKGFGEFVQLWTKTNEQAFIEFFRTEEFAQLQGIVLDTALDCRKEYQQLMESALKDLPVALRSEMDDVSKTNYSLNKTVRALKKKSSEIDKLHQEIKDLKDRVATLEQELAAAQSS